jgi:hypothetical protein
MIPRWLEILESIVGVTVVILVLVAYAAGVGSVILAGVIFMARSAFPQDEYHGLQRADGMNCCGGNDCRPLKPGELRQTNDEWEVLYKEKWIPVLPIAILKNESWDGRDHACIADYTQTGGGISVRCLVLDLRV